MDDIVIVSAVRTPVGSFSGALGTLSAHALGTIALQAVLVAVIVGGLQALNLIGAQLGLAERGGFFALIAAMNDNFGVLGVFIVGIFILAWVVSYGVYRARNYDEIGAVAE